MSDAVQRRVERARERFRSHPLADGYAPSWADGWGEDRWGPFVEVELGAGARVRFRWVPPGEFWMGSPEDDEEADGDEWPRHRVRITQGYWMADTAVTQRQWGAVMPENPSRFGGEGHEDHPVEQVTWEDCATFIDRLNEGRPGFGLRLPSEAEWERACRAGDPAVRYGELGEVAWFEGNSGGKTQRVGQLRPNSLGLFDMLGNVFEWCADGMRDYRAETSTDPYGRAGDARVFRGGSWLSSARVVRAAYRSLWLRADR